MLVVDTLLAHSFAFSGGVSAGDLNVPDGFDALIPLFQQVETESGVPAGLLAGVAWSESNFNPKARNALTGAAGLMQIIPSNFSAYNLANNPYDPLGNIRAGAADLLAKGYGRTSLLKVIQGYNGFTSFTDPDKLSAFTLYFRRITSRWGYLTVTRRI